jgi:hypothetical protein
MNEKLDMTKNEFYLEIYRQKYENFRHFDNLRWHIPTYCFGFGSMLLGFASKKDQPPDWWAFVVFGFLSLFSSYAIIRVRKGINNNNIALRKVAFLIGDTDIPLQRPSGGATWWLTIILSIVGLASILFGLYIRFL